MSVFNKYDIRGVYGLDLSDAFAYRIGKACGLFFKSREIVVARDMRLSSPVLTEALIQGLRDSGIGVLDLGVVDTPCLYFATGYLKVPGIMVTASHNPKEWNGFYICYKDAEVIGRENGLLRIEKMVGENKTLAISKNIGSYRQLDLARQYVKHVMSFKKESIEGLKIVIDSGNGMGSWSSDLIFNNLGMKVWKINGELDGNFPNHEPNTAVYENLRQLGSEVVRRKADFGIAFDGDADRAAFVDERGEPIEGSITGALLARHLLKKNKGRIVYSSTCSHNLVDIVKNSSGVPIKERVGHTLIGARMRQEKAIFGAENTGHFFYKDNFYSDSGIISALLMCQIYKKANKKMSQLVLQATKYHKLEEYNLKIKDTSSLLEDIEKFYKLESPRVIEHIDGLSIEFPDYWFSVRISETEKVVRLNVEAHTKEAAEIYLKKLIRVVNKVSK
ncbi:MAG: phosphomannomutase/phosphoglucomutase [Nanoarchaeota archaeon]